MNPLRVVVKKYTAARLAAPFFFFFWGDVEVGDILPCCLASLLLGGSGGGFALLVGLCHRGRGLVLVAFLVGHIVVVACVTRV